MKQTLATLIAIAAFAAHGASFTWGAGSAVVTFDGTKFTTADYNVKAYLVFLGSSSDTSSLVSYTADGTMTLATPATGTGSSTAPVTTGLASAKGKLKATYNDQDNGNIAAGNYFAAYLVYTASDKTYYNVSSAIAASLDETGAFNSMDFSFDFSSSSKVKEISEAGSVASGSGWTAVVAVPEPSVALMGLLGIGMLIRRRKA